MSLLRNTDPRFWLAKIIAEPEPTGGVYDSVRFRKAALAVVKMDQIATATLRIGLQDSRWPWDSADLQNMMDPLVSRGDAFVRFYQPLIQRSLKEPMIQAPNFKADAIEMLTFAAATIDGVRNVIGSVSWLTELQDAAGNAGAAVFELLTNLIKTLVAGVKLITLAVGVVGGLWVYNEFIRPPQRGRS